MKVSGDRAEVTVQEDLPDMPGGVKASRSWTFNAPDQAEKHAAQFADVAQFAQRVVAAKAAVEAAAIADAIEADAK